MFPGHPYLTHSKVALIPFKVEGWLQFIWSWNVKG